MKHGIYSLLLLLLCAGAFLLGRRSVAPAVETNETVRIDTVYRDRPLPVAGTIRRVTVNVPRVLFAENRQPEIGITAPEPSDSVIKDYLTTEPDSVAVEIPIETRTYRDSLLTAQVSGPVVGDYRPTLDWYEMYNRTRTVTQTVVKRPRFAVTAGVGAACTPNGIQPVAGIQVGVVLWSF